MEKWKAIPGFTGYEVSNRGNVRSLDRWRDHAHSGRNFYKGKMLTGNPTTPEKYVYVRLVDDSGKRATYRVHQLVMLAFKGPPPEGRKSVCHKNDRRNDNRLSNLRYGSQKENSLDAKRNGLLDERRSNLTVEEVARLETLLHDPTVSIARLCRSFALRKSTVEKIRDGKTWSKVTGRFHDGSSNYSRPRGIFCQVI